MLVHVCFDPARVCDEFIACAVSRFLVILCSSPRSCRVLQVIPLPHCRALLTLPFSLMSHVLGALAEWCRAPQPELSLFMCVFSEPYFKLPVDRIAARWLLYLFALSVLLLLSMKYSLCLPA